MLFVNKLGCVRTYKCICSWKMSWKTDDVVASGPQAHYLVSNNKSIDLY